MEEIKMKKLLAIILTLASIACIFCGCGKNAETDEKKTKEKTFLPAGIKFEMSYDKIKEKLPDTLIHNGDNFPELDENNSVSAMISDDQWYDFLGSDVELGMKTARYHFDHGEDLYSLFAYFSFENESDLEDLLNVLVDYYSKLTDTDPKETTDVLSAKSFDWETDNVKVQIYLASFGDYFVLKITHPEYSHPY
jgi:hypothetical protein